MPSAYIKLLMPFVIVLPGICAYIISIVRKASGISKHDDTSSKWTAGLTFAALIAAIVFTSIYD